jgi:EPS-associated MarR family transcriptional regulator
MIGRMGGSLLHSKKSLHSQMTSQFAQHQEDLQFRLLRVLQDKPDVSQRELASQLGISHGKMNYCLNALIEKGLVKLDNFQNSQHKFKYAYLLTPAGIAEKAKLTSRFLQRKIAEYEELRVEIDALKAELPKSITKPPRPR